MTTKKQGSPLHAKACAMVDVSRNLIYSIVSAFHDKTRKRTKGGLFEKDWVTKSKPLLRTYEMLVQKLRHFLDFQAS